VGNKALFPITFNTNPFPVYIRHTTVIKFDWNMGFITRLLPVKMAKSHKNGTKWVFQLALSLHIMIYRNQAFRQLCIS